MTTIDIASNLIGLTIEQFVSGWPGLEMGIGLMQFPVYS